MDKITLDLNGAKRVHSIDISQAMNVDKMIDEYINEHLKDKIIHKLYIGYDNEYFQILKFDSTLTDIFDMKLTSPIDMKYQLVNSIPDCDVLFVFLDHYIDKNVMQDILRDVSLTTHIIYIYDSLISDYSDGEFYKRFINADSIMNTYNRRTDIKPAINTLLNKLKKHNIKYLTSPEIQNPDYEITFEQPKTEDLLNYDKIVLVNSNEVAEYNSKIRKLLARGFLPEPRDRMITYTPIHISIYDEELDDMVDITIPEHSELVVLEKVLDEEFLVAPEYRFKYHTGKKEIEFIIPINLSFIKDLNDDTVDEEDIPMSYNGYKVYFSYALPLYALHKRYNNILFIVEDEILNKGMLYSALRFVKEKFKLVYKTNIYIGN